MARHTLGPFLREPTQFDTHAEGEISFVESFGNFRSDDRLLDALARNLAPTAPAVMIEATVAPPFLAVFPTRAECAIVTLLETPLPTVLARPVASFLPSTLPAIGRLPILAVRRLPDAAFRTAIFTATLVPAIPTIIETPTSTALVPAARVVVVRGAARAL